MFAADRRKRCGPHTGEAVQEQLLSQGGHPEEAMVAGASEARKFAIKAGWTPSVVAQVTYDTAVKSGLDVERATVLAGEAAGQTVLSTGGTAAEAGRAAAAATAAQGGTQEAQAAAAGMRGRRITSLHPCSLI